MKESKSSALELGNFVTLINQVYCLKAHFSERMIDLVDAPTLSKVSQELKNLILETDVELLKLDDIFAFLGERNSFECLQTLIDPLDGLCDELANAINRPECCHVIFYDYLSRVKSLEESYLLALFRAGTTLGNSELNALLLPIHGDVKCDLVYNFKSLYPSSFFPDASELSLAI